MIMIRSSQLREQGNKAYTSKKNSQALKLYTESVRYAYLDDDDDDDDLDGDDDEHFQVCPLLRHWSGRRTVHGLRQQVLGPITISYWQYYWFPGHHYHCHYHRHHCHHDCGHHHDHHISQVTAAILQIIIVATLITTFTIITSTIIITTTIAKLTTTMSSRSAVLAQGQQWNLALQDIQLSFEAGYPKGCWTSSSSTTSSSSLPP